MNGSPPSSAVQCSPQETPGAGEQPSQQQRNTGATSSSQQAVPDEAGQQQGHQQARQDRKQQVQKPRPTHFVSLRVSHSPEVRLWLPTHRLLPDCCCSAVPSLTCLVNMQWQQGVCPLPSARLQVVSCMERVQQQLVAAEPRLQPCLLEPVTAHLTLLVLHITTQVCRL